MQSIVYYHASIILWKTLYLMKKTEFSVFFKNFVMMQWYYFGVQKEYIFIKKKNTCGRVDVLSEYSLYISHLN